MCGIVGAVGRLYKKEKEAVSAMFLVNATRGVHGCGILYLWEEYHKNKKEKHWYNTATTEKHSASYVFTKEYQDHMSQNGMRAFVGHSRWATVGGVKKENNHPFEFDSIIGFQNGTIRGKFEFSEDYDTDTQAFFANVDKHGLKLAIENVYSKSHDMAFTFVLYDRDAREIQLIRNKDRPMSLASTNDTVFFASDRNHLEFGLKSAGFKELEYDIVDLPPFLLVRLPVWSGNVVKEMSVEEDFVTLKPKKIEYNWQSNGKGGYSYGSNSYGSGVISEWDEYLKTKDDKTPKNNNLMTGTKSGTGDKNKNNNNKNNKDNMALWAVGNRSYGQVFLENVLSSGCAVCGNPQHYIHKARFGRSSGGALEFYCDDCKDKLEPYGLKWEDQLKAEPVV